MESGLNIILLSIVILLLIMIFALLNINTLMSRQLKQNKELEFAVYRLIEITKNNQKNE